MPIGKVYEAPPIHFTPVLNAGLNWDQLDRDVRDAFSGIAQKVKLGTGFRLYKFTANPFSWQGRVEPKWQRKEGGGWQREEVETKAGVTPWWSPFDLYQWDPGLRARINEANELSVDPVELTRAKAAVRTNWNALTRICATVLVKDVYGFWGACGWQPKFGDQSLEHMRSFDKVLDELRSKFGDRGPRPPRIGLAGGAGQFYIPNLQLYEHIRSLWEAPVDDVVARRGTWL
jgi:hypothetical protein